MKAQDSTKPPIDEVKEALGIDNKDLAEVFGLDPRSYARSSARPRYEKAVVSLYKLFKNGKPNKP